MILPGGPMRQELLALAEVCVVLHAAGVTIKTYERVGWAGRCPKGQTVAAGPYVEFEASHLNATATLDKVAGALFGERPSRILETRLRVRNDDRLEVELTVTVGEVDVRVVGVFRDLESPF